MADLKIGKVTHNFDKIKVAIIELNGNLSVGDKIKFVRGGEDLFEQVIESMQIEHNNIESAKKGQVIGLKVEGDVREGSDVYKIQ